jgi:ADP-heptose:LPS heptosyltransferase
VRAIAAHFEGRLRLVAEGGVAELFFRDVPLLEVVPVTMHRTAQGRRFSAREVAGRVADCDLFLSLVPWDSRSLVELRTRLPKAHTVGFFADYQHALTLDYDKHSAELAFDVARWLNPSLKLEDFAMPPALPPRFLKRAARYRAILPRDSKILVVHNETLPEKAWPPTRLWDTLKRFLNGHQNWYAFILSTKRALRVSGIAAERIIPVCGLHRGIALAVAGGADLFVGADSCMLHAADLHRVPGVGLFGPTNPLEFGFRFSRHRHLRASDGMMVSIESDLVLNAICDLAASLDRPLDAPPSAFGNG